MNRKAAVDTLEAAIAAMPLDLDLVIFVVADAGDKFEAGLIASLAPDVFAPILRAWLERYDRGEAAEMVAL